LAQAGCTYRTGPVNADGFGDDGRRSDREASDHEDQYGANLVFLRKPWCRSRLSIKARATTSTLLLQWLEVVGSIAKEAWTMTDRYATQMLLAWAVAMAATLGALFIGEIMGQMPCTLCWYQRIAMFPLALILGVATYRRDTEAWRYALPLAVAGLALAGYHSLQYSGVLPEPIVPCQANGPSCSGEGMLIMGIPIPYLSTLAFAAITALLVPLSRKSV
jgi:disulfide bond formation protein DsbB